MPAVTAPTVEVRTRQTSGTGRDEDGALDALWQSTRPAAHSHSLSSPTHFTSRTHSSSSSSSPSASSFTRSQRALESGHVFVRHSLRGRHVSSERVVLFVLGGALYACKHAKQQSRYKQPFLSLPLTTASDEHPLRVLMGKQTAALRLVPHDTAPERRCFALALASTVLELEAPGSGDVRYWLRCLYELLTRTHALSIARSLLFVAAQPASVESAERAEWRMRQLRLEGQRVRRREEADRRMGGQQRTADEKAREEADRAAEVEARRQGWVEVQREAESRVVQSCSASVVAAVSLSPSLAACAVLPSAASARRLDGDGRMREASRREAEWELERRRLLSLQPPQHVPALASEYAKHNQRSATLQTHTTAPLLAHGAQSSGGGARRLGESKSFPNLVAALSPSASSVSSASPSSASAASAAVAPPTSASRSLSSPALRTASPSQRRLPAHLPLSHSSSPLHSDPNSPPNSPRGARTSPAAPLCSAGSLPTGQAPSAKPLSPACSPGSASAPPASSQPPRALFSALAPELPHRWSSTPLHTVQPSAHKSLFHAAAATSTPPAVSLHSALSPFSSCASALSPFEPASPFLPHHYASAASLYSPTHCPPATAVYSLHTPPAADNSAAAVAAAWPASDKLSAVRCSSDSALRAAVTPGSSVDSSRREAIRFHCAIELPASSHSHSHSHSHSAAASATGQSDPPPHSTSPVSPHARSGGTHFHFHVHTSHSHSHSHSHPHSAASTTPTVPPPPYDATRAAAV